MVGRKGQILLHSRIGSPPELHSVYEMRDSCIQHGDGLSNPNLLHYLTRPPMWLMGVVVPHTSTNED